MANAYPVNTPYPIFTDSNGSPLNDGYIYIGSQNLNPETDPIAVYWDAAMTIPAAQPIRTIGGYPSRNGTPSRLYVNQAFSITVRDVKKVVVYNSPNVTDAFAALPYPNAQTRTITSKFLEHVSVFDFMTQAQIDDVLANTALVDVTSAINNAIQAAKTYKVKEVFFPRGTYRTSATINIKGNFDNGIVLNGDKAKITCTANTEVMYVDARLPEPSPEYRIQAIIQGFVISGTGLANPASVALYLGNCANVAVRDCTLRNAYRALAGFGCLISDFRDLIIRESYYGVQFENTAYFAPNDIHFHNCQILDNIIAVRAINFDYGAWTFVGCEIEGNNLSGTTTDTVRVCEFFGAGEVTFIGCHFEINYGQYNIFYNGTRHLNMIGCKVIPGDSCGYCIYMDSGELFVTGCHVAHNVAQQQIYLNDNVKSALVVGNTSGYVSGTATGLSKLIRIWQGHIDVQGASSGVAGITSKSTYGIGLDIIGMMRFVDASYNRLGYFQPSGITIDASQAFSIATGYGSVQFMRTGKVVEPGQDNLYNLGSAPLRWANIYAGNGSIITTSDERAKEQIESIPQEWLDVWSQVQWVRFKFKDSVVEKGDGARWHTGVIAQRVKEAFESRGINPFTIGILCHDTWEDIWVDTNKTDEKGIPLIDEKGDPIMEKILVRVAGDQYSIRYEEALALEAAYLRSKINQPMPK